MELESTVKAYSAALTSPRATDRKKSAEALKDLLTRNALASLLTKNSLQKRGFTWNSLFDDINDYILKETDKFETSKTFDNVTAPLCTSLLHLCVAGSNKGQAHIKCDRLVDACLNILRDGRLTRAFGDAYLNLLYKYVLPCDYYLGYLTPVNWEDLLNVCITVSLGNNSKLDNYTKLRIVSLIIRNAKKYTQFTISLRDSLPKLHKCFIHVQGDKKVQEIVIEIVTHLLEELSTESRLTMCDFTEKNIPILFKFYDQNLEQKKKASLFRVLDMTLLLHHPRGKLSGEEGSMASNWEIWNKHLNSVLEIVSLEVLFLQKSRKLSDNDAKSNVDFYSLAANVYFQAFHCSSNSDVEPFESEVGSSSKRQKTTFNKYKTYTDLIHQLQINHLPWLGIIHKYLKKYDCTILASDYLATIKTIDSLLNNSQNLNWDALTDIIDITLSKKFLINEDEFAKTITSLWNSCVRNSTSPGSTHKHLHEIIQILLKSKMLKYQNIQPLLKLYLDKSMPTNSHTIKTLIVLLKIFFSKCSQTKQKIEFFEWFIQGENCSVDNDTIEELFNRLISNENVTFVIHNKNPNCDHLLQTIFYESENSILFSEFEFKVPSTASTGINEEKSETQESPDIDSVINECIQNSLEEKLSLLTDKFKANDLQYTQYLNTIDIVLAYLDVLFKSKLSNIEEIKHMALYTMLKTSLKGLFLSLTRILNGNERIETKIKVLKDIRQLMVSDYGSFICILIRRTINEDFFHCINNNLTAENPLEDDIIFEGDDNEINATTLKYHCLYTLAAYCRIRANYRDELLELVFDPKLYNLSSVWDVKCAYKCLEIMTYPGLEEPPLEPVFKFMQYLCKYLFRSPEATLGLLNIFLILIKHLWTDENNMKQNCFIMVRGYLERCDKGFYPPNVAAIIFKCAAKIMSFNNNENRDIDDNFIKAIIKKTKGYIHCLRLYCCYLLKELRDCTQIGVDNYLCSLSDIFVVNVSENVRSVLKDESTNRALTILHCYSAMSLANKASIRKILHYALQALKEKSLDVKIVKKVLNDITDMVTKKDLDVYLNSNILYILNFWFMKNYYINELPLQLFGLDDQGMLLEKHMKWLVSTDILWRNEGYIKNSEILKSVREKVGTSDNEIVEECFCNIIVLCLPYIVAEKYKLRYASSETQSEFKQSTVNAHRMFQMTRQIIGNEKWSNLFVENVGELLLLTATHLNDYNDATERFGVNVPENNEIFQYPKNVFSAILTYFGELTDGDIMQYLCENQPVAIFKILLKLWENVLQEEVFEYKVISINSFVTFTENIPLTTTSDGFICNYCCNCFAYAIKKSKNRDELKVLALGLKLILQRLLPVKVDELRKAIASLMSILIIKKEEEFENECAALFDYLVIDMKEYLKEGEDVVDYLRSMSQRSVGNIICYSFNEFSDRLKTYKLALTCPSYETLCNFKEFLKANKHYVNNLCIGLNTNSFSEECGESVVHQIIYELNNILTSVTDSKTVIEACGCLAEIGTYDLKTLVTVPPADARTLASASPKQSFANAVVSSLSEALFDENPAVTNKITKTLHCLLKFSDGVQAIESTEIDNTILQPFASDQDVISAVFKIDGVKFTKLHSIDVLVAQEKETHGEWLKKITDIILEIFSSEMNYVNALREVCILKPEVCRNILPTLIGLLLSCSAEKHVKIIGEQINRFFKYIWETSYDERVENSGDSSNYSRSNVLNQDHKLIIQYMIDVVNVIRLQRTHYKSRQTRLETLNYLNLDYDKVAWAATVADQNLAAIYYGELWAVAQNDCVPPASPEITFTLDGGRDLQRILRKSFVSIGEMDAIDGCGTAHLTIDDEKRKHLINTGQYQDALLLHDIALSCSHSTPDLHSGVVRSLHKSGMHHLALQYIKSLPETEELNDIKYECLSYLGDWSEFVDTRELEEKSKESNCNTQSILKAFRYSCLKDCINIQVKPELECKLLKPINRAKLAVSRWCQKLNMENCQNFYKVLSKLHLFSDIESYYEVRFDKLPLHDLLHKWRVENLPVYHDFKHLEDLIGQRSLILEHSAKIDSLKDIASLQLQYAELSLSNQRIQMAQRLVSVVKNLQNSEEVTLLESQISWAKGHQDIAISLLRNIVSKPAHIMSPDLRQEAICLRQYGLWMAESKSDNPPDIINKYLKKSLDILNRTNDVKIKLKIYFDIAKFADAEFKQILNYMNSSIYENKVKCLENMKDSYSSLKSTQQSEMTRDERRALNTTEKLKQLTENEIASTRAERECFLQLALRYYLLSLKESEENNLSVFRVVSLWLDNPNIMLDETEGPSFEDLLDAIPSRKFITVLPQLAPRLSDETTPFADNLRKILTRCAEEHPHHTLPILFSLKNSDKDKYILNASGGARSQRPAAEPRVVAAEKLVANLAGANEKLADIIAQMERLCDATISFANYKPKVKEQRQKIPAAENILKLFHLDAIPIPTDTIPVRDDCNYENLCTLVSFDNYFELVGGINCPKKINCKGSDGKKKILLIKGEDDLRQDAVMQQVFNIVNTLLERNPITSRNKLVIRTYKVVPMSRQSGVLEWCEGTLPIGAYLVGTNNTGAHARYRPQDISCAVARQKLQKCHEGRKSNKDKLAVFLSILREFKPVFHYFFTEHYLDPVQWYERRLAYTKSVATSSMVGYILGLGDRHVQNILIDKNTAEVIHIDFGIAFDQGKALPTPETIPFRLTQDMIAGFGCSGVEGIFRRCCEKTMQLLRDNQDTLLTILEVLLCDPLYTWTVAPINAATSKDTTICAGSGGAGGLAARALLSVGSKLSGAEGGAARGVSVSAHVARLLLTAADPANLCRLFPGWQPYL